MISSFVIIPFTACSAPASITISPALGMRGSGDNIIKRCDQKSAGVDVGIGGHSQMPRADEQQFDDDTRTVTRFKQQKKILLLRNLQPVMSENGAFEIISKDQPVASSM